MKKYNTFQFKIFSVSVSAESYGQILSFGFGIGPKPKRWFRSYTNFYPLLFESEHFYLLLIFLAYLNSHVHSFLFSIDFLSDFNSVVFVVLCFLRNDFIHFIQVVFLLFFVNSFCVFLIIHRIIVFMILKLYFVLHLFKFYTSLSAFYWCANVSSKQLGKHIFFAGRVFCLRISKRSLSLRPLVLIHFLIKLSLWYHVCRFLNFSTNWKKKTHIKLICFLFVFWICAKI